MVDEPIQWIEIPTAKKMPEDEPTPAVAETNNDAEIEIQWEEEAAAAPVVSRPERSSTRVRPAPATREIRSSSRPSVSSNTSEASDSASSSRGDEADETPRRIASPAGVSFGQRIYRNRHWLTVFCVIVLVVTTVGFRMHQQYWENLPKIAETSKMEGLQALRTGVFDVAKQQLAIAADALERLRDPEAAQVRQAASEAAIFADLANRSLEELLEQMAVRRTEGAEWFQDRHKGRSILIDANMMINRTRRTLDYRLFSGAKRGWIDLEGFSLLEAKSDAEPVTFGARLDSMHLERNGEWRIVLEPESGVYLSTNEGWEALRTLGWPDRTIPIEELP